jgi:uncharacterized protein (TIGR02145 family)
VGANQHPGNNKEIIWDVLAEREKLSGEIKFKIEATPSNTGYFADKRDGQIYKWVKVGNQIWMAENLYYKTGNSLCYYNVTANCNKYGRLYDWETAKRACPRGWYLPSNSEWNILINYLGGNNIAGKKMKATSGWSSNGNGIDVVDFSALPGGYRDENGSFYNIGSDGYWWSASEYSSIYRWLRSLHYNLHEVIRSSDIEESGFSVRCVRD